MVKINGYDVPKNIEKPVATVYELKSEDYKVPSFEEFMKDYKVDEEVESSYNSELGGYEDIGVEKGYGPTTYGRVTYYYNGVTYDVENIRFFIILESQWGVDGQWFFGIPTYRSPKRSIDPMNDEARRFINSISRNDYRMDGIWQDGLMRWRIVLNTPEKAEKLLRYFASGGLKVRGRGDVHHRGAQNDIINTLNTALETYRSGGKVSLIGREF